MYEYKVNIVPGATFGRWTVLDEVITTPRKEKKWLCQCSCGTRRYVLERSLRNGGSLSCGCLRKEAAEKAVANDIAGQRFGDLTALERSDSYHKNGGIWWKCRCVCGTVCEVPSTLLVNGRKTHCGCKTRKDYHFADIRGQRFSRLVALSPTDKRDGMGGVIWHCRCDCGNEVDVPYNSLVHSHQRSCGCRKKEHNRQLGQLQTRVGGTSLELIQSKKVPSDSSTGFKGVYLIKGKYVAKINFQRKAYYLGAYDTVEEAHEARLNAEEALYQATLDYHARWQARADADPEWAAANPMEIFVRKDNGGLHAEFAPVL